MSGRVWHRERKGRDGQEIGKQAAVLKELTKERAEDMEIALKEFVGHTPSQVVAGILLGLAVGLTVSLL